MFKPVDADHFAELIAAVCFKRERGLFDYTLAATNPTLRSVCGGGSPPPSQFGTVWGTV